MEYAPKNMNATVYSSQFGIQSTALLSVIALGKGVYYYKTYDRSVNTDKYVAFLESLKKKHGKSPCAIYLDSLRVHQTLKARQLCEENDIELIWAPIYKPDYNPIEHMHSILKQKIKKQRLSDMLK